MEFQAPPRLPSQCSRSMIKNGLGGILDRTAQTVLSAPVLGCVYLVASVVEKHTSAVRLPGVWLTASLSSPTSVPDTVSEISIPAGQLVTFGGVAVVESALVFPQTFASN